MVGAAVLAACTSIVTPAPITAGEWRVSAINAHPTPPPPASYRMRFDGQQLSGQFGCNHFGGGYRIQGGVLTTGAMMMTEMACSEPVASFESWGIRVLQRPARIHWESPDRVTLSNDAGSIELSR